MSGRSWSLLRLNRTNMLPSASHCIARIESSIFVFPTKEESNVKRFIKRFEGASGKRDRRKTASVADARSRRLWRDL